MLRRSEPTCFSSASENEVGGFLANIGASGASHRTLRAWRAKQSNRSNQFSYPSGVTETTLLAARPTSVGAMLSRRVAASPSKEAFRYVEDDRWVSLSWSQTKDKVFQLAAGLLSLGIGPEDRVAIASNTRMEWVLADLAIMSAAGATTTIYPSTQHEDVCYRSGRLSIKGGDR